LIFDIFDLMLSDWVSFLAYPNLFGIKGFVVVVVVVVTSHINDVGAGQGKYYGLNAPLSDGIDDDSFQGLFNSIIYKVMEVYQLVVVILQCGADSLAGDKLGCFNLPVRGHADCLRYLR
jgi:acetoin utilization deacetylase AcuC-like enzyme